MRRLTLSPYISQLFIFIYDISLFSFFRISFTFFSKITFFLTSFLFELSFGIFFSKKYPNFSFFKKTFFYYAFHFNFFFFFFFFFYFFFFNFFFFFLLLFSHFLHYSITYRLILHS